MKGFFYPIEKASPPPKPRQLDEDRDREEMTSGHRASSDDAPALFKAPGVSPFSAPGSVAGHAPSLPSATGPGPSFAGPWPCHLRGQFGQTRPDGCDQPAAVNGRVPPSADLPRAK